MPLVGDSIYHGYGVGYTMGRESDTPWVKSSIYTMYPE